MNPEWLHVVLTLIVAVAGLGNFVVQLRIDKRIAENTSALKEWCNQEFVTKREIDLRFEAMERR